MAPRIKEDLAGKIFSRWTVLSRDESKIGKIRGSYWICKCSCGNIKSVSRHSLCRADKTSHSCGCITKEVAMARCLPDSQSDKNNWIDRYKKRSKKLGIEFSLTDERFFEICSQNCYYCNAEPENKYAKGYVRKGKGVQYKANGIDKIDPKVGYIEGNCLPCCRTCNFMKSDTSFEDFLSNIKNICNISPRSI